MDLRRERVEKFRELGVNPYPSKLENKNVSIASISDKVGKLGSVAGRIMGWRGHGNSIFADLKDDSGNIQIFFQKKNLGDKFSILKLVDVGDFILVSGKIFKTQAGEVTLDVGKYQILSKSIRPLPSSWHGLKDAEERYRQRYVDLLLNDSLKELFRRKAIFWQSMREFLVKKGFLEVETPVLENIAGGADANPFVTHHDALDIDLYLRISMGELWQKRLMVAGFEKTFELGRQFRNEGISREHLQDYSQMEFYWAFANYEDSMKLVEEMYKFVAKSTFGKLQFKIGKFEIDLSKPWKKIDYVKTLEEYANINVINSSETELKSKLKEFKIVPEKNASRAKLIDQIWKSIRRRIEGPVFLIGHPVEVSPLAKRQEINPDFVERYQVVLAGSEMGNGYSELNDPVDQANRFKEQQAKRDKGDTEAQMYDLDFVRALEYGMPPVTGFGVSERLFSFLADKPVRETVLFPLLRPEK